MNRGINRQNIFRDDRDRSKFSELVKEYKEECGASVYHWSWMSNHYHMLIEVVFDNLRPFVSGVQQTYAQYYHDRHGSCGVFWQGRYKSKPVEVGEYLARCGKYIERNPVRAGVVDVAEEYQWSSAQHYVTGLNSIITDHNPYCGGDREDVRFREWYQKSLAAGLDDEWMKKRKKKRCLGSDAYCLSLKTSNGRHRRKRGSPVKL